MQRISVRISQPRQKRQAESGVALLTTLLLLLLLTGLSLAMVISVRSDLLVNGYYRNFRGSFYAADSGLNIVRADMVARIFAAVPANVPINTPPIPANTDQNVLKAINDAYTPNYQITGSGTVAGSWPASFNIDPDPNQTKLTQLSCTPKGPNGTNWGTCANPLNNPPSYSYDFSYSVATIGQTRGGEKATMNDIGKFTLLVSTNPGAMQLRTLQTMAEIATERNSTIIFPIPVEVISIFRGLGLLCCVLVVLLVGIGVVIGALIGRGRRRRSPGDY